MVGTCYEQTHIHTRTCEWCGKEYVHSFNWGHHYTLCMHIKQIIKGVQLIYSHFGFWQSDPRPSTSKEALYQLAMATGHHISACYTLVKPLRVFPLTVD